MTNAWIAALLAAQLATMTVAAPVQPPAADDDTMVTGIVITLPSRPKEISAVEFQALEKNGWRAPHYSLEQIASFQCAARNRRVRGVNQGLQAANQAMYATERFEKVKADFRAGRATLEDLQRAEAARQTAVLALGGKPYLAEQLSDSVMGSLSIENTSFRFAQDKERVVILVSGEMRNTGNKPVRSPLMVASALDRFGVVLAEESFAMNPKTQGGITIEPGEAAPFQVVFPDGPKYTYAMKVHFGVARTERNPRCLAMDEIRRVENNAPYMGDAAQKALEASLDGKRAYGDKFSVSDLSVRPVKDGEVVVLDISAVIRNGSPDRQNLPPLTILLKGEGGEVVGLAQVDLGGGSLDGEATAPLKLRADIQWRQTSKGPGSIDQMKSVALVFG